MGGRDFSDPVAEPPEAVAVPVSENLVLPH